jgi:RNA polymerase sigma factor (sigma-70 family)
MATTPLKAVLRQIHQLAGPAAGEAADPDLLRRFVATRDESAFAELVRRHGPLVWGVCRRVLRHEQDAEDAFQATFLVLLRRAVRIRKCESVAAWLHAVAYRLAKKAEAAAARRRARAPAHAAVAHAETLGDVTWREVRALLDEELQRLPEKYRAPLLLCYLEGQTQDEAARRLGWTPGTLRGRVDRGRALLGARLRRRGIDLGGGLLAVVLAEHAADGAAATERTACLAAGGLVSGRAAALADALCRGAAARGKLAALVLLTLAALATGVGLCAYQEPGPQPRRADGVAPPPALAAPGPAAGQEVPGKGAPPRQDVHGDPLPPGAVARLGTTRLRGGRLMTGFALSPDGKVVAGSGDDGTVGVWDTDTGKEVRVLRDGAGSALCVAFSPDGKLLAAGRPSGAVTLWDAATGKPAGTVGLKAPVQSLAISPDGKALAAGTERGEVGVWETGTRRQLWQGKAQPHGVWALSFSPDGKLLATACLGDRARLWHARSGKPAGEVRGDRNAFINVALLPGNKTLLAASADGRVHFWDVASGRDERQLGGTQGGGFSCLALSADGRILVTGRGGDKMLRVHDVASGRELRQLHGVPAGLQRVTMTPDGRTVAAAHISDNQIYLWDVATGKQKAPAPGHCDRVNYVRFTPDGKTLVTASNDRTARVWDVAAARELRRFDALDYRAALCPHGKLLAFPMGTVPVRIHDLAGNRARELPGAVGAFRLDFTPDGRGVAVAGDGFVGVWDVDTGQVRNRVQVAERAVFALAVSPDGQAVACGGQNGRVDLWDLATGRKVRHFPAEANLILSVAFSADGRLITAGEARQVRVWEVATGGEVQRLAGHAGGTLAVAFSPDCRLVATGGADGVVAVWELASGGLVGRLAGHRGGAYALAYSPDGRLLASGSADSTVLVWDVPSVAGVPVAREPTAKERDRLWDDLSGADAAAAYRAVWALAAGRDRTVAFLKGRLVPAGLPAVNAERVQKWIGELDDARFKVREAAHVGLKKAGAGAEAAMERALVKARSEEMRRRLQRLLAERKAARGAPRAPASLRTLRGIEVLERIGSAEAREVLRDLAAQPFPGGEDQEASAALRRLAGKRTR